MPTLREKIMEEKHLTREKMDNLESSVKKSQKLSTNNVRNVEKSLEVDEKLSQYLETLTPSEKKAFLDKIKYKEAREHYINYMQLCFPTYTFTRFHKFLCSVVESVVRRVEKANTPNATEEDIKNGRITICLSVPPQHGKSETITKTAPSWFVGRNPDKSAILTAYNSDMGEKFNNANREKIKRFGKQVFGIEVSDSQDNKALFEIKDHRGFIMGVGIQGGITGNGAELIIVDDPYKSSAEANSPTIRKQIEDTYRDSVVTRLHGKGYALIIIQTRWHEDDLCGVVSKEDGTIVINIPAVCEDEKYDALHRKLGETLCPELGFDSLWAEQRQKAVGRKVWEALYQGHPTIDGGEIITRNMVKFYKKSELPSDFEEVTMSCDLSFGGKDKANDPCAIQVWGRVGANHYLLHRTKKRLTFTEMCEKIKSIRALFPQVKKIIVEKKANGQSVIDTLNSSIGGFVAYDPKMDSKVARVNAITYLLESGNVFFPDISIDHTIDEMVEEMLKFPNGSHDDEVDAMSQYLISWDNTIKGGIGKIENDNRFVLFAKAIRSM